MNFKLEKLVGITRTVKTPLALSGIIIIILYAIYRQILSLNVFENIGSTPTFILLQGILDKLFWLALIALILGVASYLVSVFLAHKNQSLSSNVKMLNASLDPHDSPYDERIEEGRRVIQPKEFKSDNNPGDYK